MNLRLVHRRLAVLMGLAGLTAFAGRAGFEPMPATLAIIALGVALFWHPEKELSHRLERVWLPLAALLAGRALFHFFVVRDDIVIPVVDLLLLLLRQERHHAQRKSLVLRPLSLLQPPRAAHISQHTLVSKIQDLPRAFFTQRAHVCLNAL